VKSSWKIWAPGILLLAVLLAGVTGNVVRGNYSVLLVLGGVVAAAALLVFASRFRARLLFRDKTPERVIAHYHTLVRRIPHADAAAAYLSSMAAAAYGDFARAHQELDAVQWADKPAMYRSQHLYALALLALMEDQAPETAMVLANEGSALETGAVQVIFHVIATASGAETDQGIQRLEETAKRRHGLVPALSMWALALYYRRVGRAADASRWTVELRTTAPNCKSLVQSRA
jgi:hypothetical protein